MESLKNRTGEAGEGRTCLACGMFTLGLRHQKQKPVDFCVYRLTTQKLILHNVEPLNTPSFHSFPDFSLIIAQAPHYSYIFPARSLLLLRLLLFAGCQQVKKWLGSSEGETITHGAGGADNRSARLLLAEAMCS